MTNDDLLVFSTPLDLVRVSFSNLLPDGLTLQTSREEHKVLFCDPYAGPSGAAAAVKKTWRMVLDP